jgi:hypothetical protein
MCVITPDRPAFATVARAPPPEMARCFTKFGEIAVAVEMSGVRLSRPPWA